MKKTLKEIASLIDGEIIGDDKVEISNINGIKEAQEGDITFLANPIYKPLLSLTKASAIITSRDIDSCPKPIIRTDNPSLAFSKIISVFQSYRRGKEPAKGIHKTAIIEKNVSLGKDISIGPYVVIEEGASIGEASTIYPYVYIGHNTKIGKNTRLYPNVVIRENCIVGSNVIIHGGTVIGSDGFGYVKVEDVHQKIPQTGIAIIEDDVEIGSNVSIDRARFGETLIGRGTKIDNLVQIAHNVKIGANSIVVSQSGISGSATLGKGVVLAGQVGVVGHVEVGDNVIVAAQSGVTKSIPANSVILGSPAKPISEEKRILASIRRLPELFKAFNQIKNNLTKNNRRSKE